LPVATSLTRAANALEVEGKVVVDVVVVGGWVVVGWVVGVGASFVGFDTNQKMRPRHRAATATTP
jgi:hypothetical protein